MKHRGIQEVMFVTAIIKYGLNINAFVKIQFKNLVIGERRPEPPVSDFQSNQIKIYVLVLVISFGSFGSLNEYHLK